MKKLTLLATLSILLFISSFAQKSFEGIVVYGIEYDGLPEGMAGQESMLPKTMKMTINGNNSIVEQNTGMMSTRIISNGDDDHITTLMEVMGNQVAIKTKEEKENSKKSPTPKIDYLDGTKKIAGYTCNEARITVEGSAPVTVYYTKKIPFPEVGQQFNQFPELKGFPMEYEVRQGEMTLTFTVNKMEEVKVPKKEFEIPEGYEEMTMQEFQEKMSAAIMK